MTVISRLNYSDLTLNVDGTESAVPVRFFEYFAWKAITFQKMETLG